MPRDHLDKSPSPGPERDPDQIASLGHGDSNAERQSSRSWFTPILLCAVYAIAFIDRSSLGVAGSLIKHDLSLTDTEFGLLGGTAFALLFCVFTVPLGMLSARADPRALLVAALVFWSSMTALSGLATSFSELAMARLGIGLGEAAFLPASMALLRRHVDRRRMGRAVAIVLVGASLGGAAAHVMGGLLLLRLQHGVTVGALGIEALAPWRVLFLVAAVPGLLVAPFLLRIPRSASQGRSPIGGVLPDALAGLWRARHGYAPLTASGACVVALTQAQAAWLPLFFVTRFGLRPGESAIAVGGIVAVSASSGQWFGGWLIDRLRRAKLPAAPNTALALCAGCSLGPLVLFCTTPSLAGAEVSYVAFLFFASAASPAGLAGWQELTRGPQVGVVTAILVSIVTLLGVGLGTPAIGVLADAVFGADQLGKALLGVLGTAAVLASSLALWGRPGFMAVASAAADDWPERGGAFPIMTNPVGPVAKRQG